MLTILISMLAILLLCGLVAAFVAFPRRGQDVAGALWWGEDEDRATDAFVLMEDRTDADVDR